MSHKYLSTIFDTVEGKLPIFLLKVKFTLDTFFDVHEGLLCNLDLEELCTHSFKLVNSHREKQLLRQSFAHRLFYLRYKLHSGGFACYVMLLILQLDRS